MRPAALVGACSVLMACSGEPDRPPMYDGTPMLITRDAGVGHDAGPPRDDCATPHAGCACDEVGTLVDCGIVIIRSGDYTTCSEGKIECLPDGVWSDCIGDQVTTK